MRKILITVMALTAMLMATPPSLCELNPSLPQCDNGSVGPQGPAGDRRCICI